MKLSAQAGCWFQQQIERMNLNLGYIRRGMLGKRQHPAAVDGIRKDVSHKPNLIVRGPLSALPRR